jgi:hypothetical protein
MSNSAYLNSSSQTFSIGRFLRRHRGGLIGLAVIFGIGLALTQCARTSARHQAGFAAATLIQHVCFFYDGTSATMDSSVSANMLDYFEKAQTFGHRRIYQYNKTGSVSQASSEAPRCMVEWKVGG